MRILLNVVNILLDSIIIKAHHYVFEMMCELVTITCLFISNTSQNMHLQIIM